MSITSNMETMTLQVKEKVESKTGATKWDWKPVKEINVSMFKTNDMINTQSIRYNESSHVGFTFYKNIKEGINRLVDGEGVIYNITGANNKGRLCNLLLKVVDTNV